MPWGLLAAHRLSLVVASGGFSLVVVHGPLIMVSSLVAEHRAPGQAAFRSCILWAQQLQFPGSRAQAQ